MCCVVFFFVVKKGMGDVVGDGGVGEECRRRVCMWGGCGGV